MRQHTATIALLAGLALGTTALADTIDGEVYWAPNTTVLVSGDLVINGILRVGEGVRIELEPNATVRVHEGATLHVEGADDAKVDFVAPAGRWRGLTVGPNTDVIITNATFRALLHQGITIDGSVPLLSRLEISNVRGDSANRTAVGILVNDGTPMIEDTVIFDLEGASAPNRSDEGTAGAGSTGSQPGGTGGGADDGERGDHGANGGNAFGIWTSDGSASIRNSAVWGLRAGRGGNGGDGGKGGFGGTGGRGNDDIFNPHGGRGGPGGDGGRGGNGGDGGNVAAFRVERSSEQVRIEQCLVYDLRSGSGGDAGDGGEGGNGGYGGWGGNLGWPFTGGTGGDGYTGGDGGNGGTAGSAGTADALWVRDANSPVIFTQCTVADFRVGTLGSAGARGDRGAGGSPGRPGNWPGSRVGADGDTGSWGDHGSAGGAYSDAYAGAIWARTDTNQPSTQAIATNNIFSIGPATESRISTARSSAVVTFVDNLIHAYQRLSQGDPEAQIGESSFSSTVDADPRFVDAASGDYRLAPDSPAIDAGNALSLPASLTEDLDGRTRRVDDPNTPDTGFGAPVVDFGAFEFQTDAPCPADINGDGDDSVLDLLAFLDLWFVDDAEADLNNDQQITVLDLLAFLDLFFAGC